MTWWELWSDFLQFAREYRTSVEITPLWFLRIASAVIADIQHVSRVIREEQDFTWDSARGGYPLTQWVWTILRATLVGNPTPTTTQSYPVLIVSPEQAQEIRFERRTGRYDTPRQWWYRFGYPGDPTDKPAPPRSGYVVPGNPPVLRVEPAPESWATIARLYYIVRYIPVTQQDPYWSGAFTDTENWMRSNTIPGALREHVSVITAGVMTHYALQNANVGAAQLFRQLYVEGRDLIMRLRPPDIHELVSPYAVSPFD